MSTVIVSAYYKIPSKAPHEKYLPYLLNFFRNVMSRPIVFFTTPDVIEEIQSHGITTDSVNIVYLPFEELMAFQRYGVDFWKRQKERDCEDYHTYQLGAIWYEKKEFVLRAIEIVKADIYIWCDAGCIRDDGLCIAARAFGSRNANVLNDNRLHLQQVDSYRKSDFYKFDYNCIAGAIIAGNEAAWKQYSQLYNTVLEKYDANCVTGMSDQYVGLSCVDTNPELFLMYPQSSSINKWFKFLELI